HCEKQARVSLRWTQGKGTHPLPLHPIPWPKRTKMCQACARSKVSGMPPAVQPSEAQHSLGEGRRYCSSKANVQHSPAYPTQNQHLHRFSRNLCSFNTCAKTPRGGYPNPSPPRPQRPYVSSRHCWEPLLSSNLQFQTPNLQPPSSGTMYSGYRCALPGLPGMVAEGYKFAAGPIVAAVAAVACAMYFGASSWLDGLAAVLVLLGLFVLYFFRDPDRDIPQDPDAVVSPADGRVMVVTPEQLDGRPGQRVSIFLSIFDVHVNRAPVSGTISALDYRRGSFHGALFERASTENEQNVIRMKTSRGELVFKQIAGLIARRILFWKERGDAVQIGDRVGMIRFGSRVDVWLPEEARITVRPGDTVRGGSSILARWQ